MHPRATIPSDLLRRPFTTAEAQVLGVAAEVLRAPRFRTPRRGVRVSTSLEPSLLLDAAAVRLALPQNALLTEWTALRLLSLPTPLGQDDPGRGRLQARVPTRHARSRVRGVDVSWLREHDLLHELRSPEARALLPRGVRGLRLQHPLAAWCDVAPSLPFVDAVALGDAVRKDWATQDQMEAAVAARAGRAGSRRLRRVLAAVRHQVDSPMETEARLLLLDAGLPEPGCGKWVADATGRLWQVDLSWPAHRVVVEYDGDIHRIKGKAQWRHDQDRRAALREAGWNVVVLVGGSLDRDDPAARELTVERVRRALAG